MTAALDTDPTRLYYVTVRDDGRTGFLLGPYDTHTEALANVGEGKRLANAATPWAAFYAFGTASLPRDMKQPKTVFAASAA